MSQPHVRYLNTEHRKPALNLNGMSALIQVYPSSLPLLIAAVLSFGACLVSYSFQFRRQSDKRLLYSYRITLLTSGTQLLVYAAVNNRWVDSALLMRFLLAGLAFHPLLMLSFRRGFQREVKARGLPELMAGLIGVTFALWMMIDSSQLVRSGESSPLGYTRIDSGAAFGVFITIIMSSTCASLAYVYSQARGSIRPQARRFVIAGFAAVLVLSFDITVATRGWDVAPLSWLGIVVLMYIFMRDTTENYRATLRAWREISSERDELYQRFIRDPLTGLATRTYGIEALEKALETHASCVVFLDLDGFKIWNDRFGHADGDRVLIEVADAIKRSVRVGDVCARYAGDEFFIILQDTKLSAGLEIANAIQDALAQIDFQVDLRVSGSIGVAAGRVSENADLVINRADKLAYEAKHGGKNRVVSDASPTLAA